MDDWTTRAACRNADPDLFAPLTGNERGDRSKDDYPERAEYAARAYCAKCSVIEQCYTQAQRNKEQGVWHGAWRVGLHAAHRTVPILEQLIPAV